MSRGASRTTIKSMMELSATKDNGESLTFVAESPASKIAVFWQLCIDQKHSH